MSVISDEPRINIITIAISPKSPGLSSCTRMTLLISLNMLLASEPNTDQLDAETILRLSDTNIP